MAGRSDCGMPAAMQSGLRYPACSPLDPAAERKISEAQGASACHAQDQTACADSAVKNVSSAQEKHIQISQSVAACL